MLKAIEHTQKNLEFINELVERITYHNEEDGFAVLKVKVRGHRDLVSLIVFQV